MAKTQDKLERRVALCMLLRKVAGDLAAKVPPVPADGDEDPDALRRRIVHACFDRASRDGYAHLLAEEPKLDELFGAPWPHVKATIIVAGRGASPDEDLEALLGARLVEPSTELRTPRLTAINRFRRLCADTHAPARI